jgi:hypothetical protein
VPVAARAVVNRGLSNILDFSAILRRITGGLIYSQRGAAWALHG